MGNIHVLDIPYRLSEHSTLSVTRPLEEVALTPPARSGPFFVLRSRCEDNPSYTPYFVVARGPCDVLFPTGTIARPYATWGQASDAAERCNQLLQAIAYTRQLQQESPGFLAYESFQRQMECQLDEIATHCFLIEQEEDTYSPQAS